MRIIIFIIVCSQISNWAYSQVNENDRIVFPKSIIADTGTVKPSCFEILKIDQKIPSIFLYDSLGHKIKTDSLFKNNKPVVFINGSYSCFVFRGNVKRINNFINKNKDKYTIYFVYVQEAHPITCSPYGTMNENVPKNSKKGINLEQPIFFIDRLIYAKKTVKDFKIQVPLLIDNEFNDYFTSVFAGLNGYLVFSPEKKLIEQRRWFHNRQYERNKRKFERHHKMPKSH